MGRRVIFDTYPTMDDCAHVCYGGTEGHAYNQDFWKQERAERIAWIEVALTHPNKIHPDEVIPTNQKYLLYVAPEAPGRESEYYVVIARVLNAKTVAFLTAYNVSEKQYQKFAGIGPRIFPAPQPKRKGNKNEEPQKFPSKALSRPYKHLAFIFSLLKPFGEVRVLTLAGTLTLGGFRPCCSMHRICTDELQFHFTSALDFCQFLI